MGRYDDEEEDRPRKKGRKGSKRSPSSGMSTGTIILIVIGGAFALLVLCGGGLAVMMVPAINEARDAAQRANARNNLKQIGLALHNYHDTYTMFPPGAIVNENGDEYMGWQGSVLPYLEQTPLFIQIHMGESWQSTGNQPIYATPLTVYLHPGLPETMTAHGQPASHFAGSTHIFLKNKGLRLGEVLDGTSNTIGVGEVSVGFKTWGDPSNLRDPALGLAQTPDQFWGPSPEGTEFLMLDGAIRTISPDVDPNVMKALATPGGGELVNEF